MITGGFPGAMLPKTPAKGKFRREDDFFSVFLNIFAVTMLINVTIYE